MQIIIQAKNQEIKKDSIILTCMLKRSTTCMFFKSIQYENV